MNLTPDDDTDWLDAEPDTSAAAVTHPPFAGVWRIEQQGEEGIPYDTLIDAQTEMPMSPEAEIRGEGGCLAQAHPDRAGWVFTQIGAERIRREANGTIAGAA